MKIVFALALGLGLSLPIASPVSAQTQSTSAARVLRRQKLARVFPQFAAHIDDIPTKVGRPKNTVTSRVTSQVRPRATDSTRLNYSFSGFTQSETKQLNDFINANYNLIVKVWGKPADEQIGKTVSIINYETDPKQEESTPQTYYPPSTSNNGGQIEFDYLSGKSANFNAFQLLKLVLNSFQGPRVPSFNFGNGWYFEPYLFGASEAAALHIIYQSQGSPANFDPTPYASYVLPFYDAFNSPALGNPYIYPRSGEDIIASDFRLAVAQAAFLKLYTEKETFFSDFNAALYKKVAARAPVSADILESVGASVLPTVEGIPYRSWIREQGALNVRVSTGNKLYLVALPIRTGTSSGSRPAVAAYAEAFATDANGQDVGLYLGAPRKSNGDLRPAYGIIDAFDEKGNNINSYAREIAEDGRALDYSGVLNFVQPNTANEASTEAAIVVDFRPFGSPAAARIKLRARLNSTETTAFFPYGAAGSTDAPSTYYGATLGGTTGKIKLTTSTQSQEIVIARGTFAGTLPTESGPRVQTTLSDGTRTFKRNTAWLQPTTASQPPRSLEFLLDGAGAGGTSSTLSLSASKYPKMIAFPLRPDERDEAKALNVTPAKDLVLARYRPDLSPTKVEDDALVFEGSKYELYPNISQGPEAGRGYWIKVPASGLTSQVAGIFPPTNQRVEIELKSGWNQVGVPRATSVNAFNVKVRYGGYAPVSLQEAQSRGWIATGVWRYNGASGYQRVDVSGGTLVPWEGYWIFASPGSGTNLVFEPTTSTQSVRVLSAPTGSWSIGIAASSSTSRDTSASFGISTQKAASKPPVAAQQLSVYFPPSDSASSSGSGSAQLFLKKLTAKSEWKFTIDGAARDERVTLYWPNFQNVPSGLQLQLRDEATKKVVTTMKNGSKWMFTSDGKPHQFTIVGTLISTSANSANGS